MFEDLQNLGVLKKEGYRINLKNIAKEDLNLIKKQLTLVPKVHKDFVKNVIKYKCYSIDEKYIYLPKYWALEKIGEPKKNLLKRGEYFNQKLKTIYPPRPFQVEIIEKTYKQLKEIGGGIITIGCGLGKTFCGINISTLINQKTLILVHTSVLLDQWIDRIKYFIPNAKIGIIQGKKFDIENKDYVVAMLQTIIRSKSKENSFKEEDFSSFGLTIYDECFPFSQYILTENGPIKIGTIYEKWKNKKILPKVKSYNEKTKKYEYKKITYAFRKENSKLLKISIGKKKIKCTENHKFLTLNGYKEAKSLTIEDLLISNYDISKTEGCISKGMNTDQEQIFLGSYLGDGGIQKLKSNRYRIKFLHCEKQKNYCQWKGNMFNIEKLTLIKENGYSKKPAYRCSTKIIDYDIFIPKKKGYCSQEILNRLDLRGLSIWIMDDGTYGRKGSCFIIHSNTFDEQTHENFKKYFKEKYNIECSYKIAKKKYYYLYFNKKNTKELLKLIEKYIHIDFLYKIGLDKDIRKDIYKWNNNFLEYGYGKISKIENIIHTGYGRCTKPYVYDIEVEDNHNFIVCGKFSEMGVVVHNCHHMAAPSFSKAFPIISSKYNLGLSATPKRSDNLQNIFYWNIGPTSFESFTNDKFAIVKNINFTDDNYVEKYNWMGSIDLHKLHLQIIENDFRNNMIIKQLVNLSKKGRQILVLSKMINHLRTLKTKFCKKKYYKNYPRKIIFEICKKKKINKKCFSLICSFIKIPVTCGYYIGGMKQSVDQSVHSKTHKELDQLIFNNIDKIKPENLKYIYNKKNELRKKINLNREDKINIVEEANIEIEVDDSIESLEKSSKCDILFASYQLVSEGTDIPTLNTLIMTTPKKQIQQVVGRILRSKTKFTPLILDIVDSSFSVYKNQSFYRNRYYRKCNYSIENIDINAKDKKIPLIGEEIIIEEKTMEQICNNFIKCLF